MARLLVHRVNVPALAEFPSEDTVPTRVRRWEERVDEWIEAKRARGKYLGKSGEDVRRFLKNAGRWIDANPEAITEPDLWRIVPKLGASPKSKRTGLGNLGSFLAQAANNWVVQRSGIRGEFPNRAFRTPVATSADWEAVMGQAQRMERIAVAWLWPRRTCELTRAMLVDLDLEAGTIDLRQKRGRGEVTDPGFPLTGTQIQEFRWYIELRRSWAEIAKGDSGHLLVRWDGSHLVGVSTQFVRRLVWSACARAGFPKGALPNHSFRRGALTHLRERGAEWEDVRDAAGHKSIGTTELYVRSLAQKRRLPTIMRMLDPQPLEAT